MASPERWQVTGSVAQQYERFVASWFRAWAEDLVDRAGIQPGWNVLDLACGTGIVSRVAAPVVGTTGTIMASDLNEGMLDEARRQVELLPNMDFQLADATELPFEDGAFDAVLCQEGLQFMPEKAAVVAEMRRVLRPGGVAATSVWRSPEHNPYISALADGLSRHVSAEAGAIMLAPCAFGDADELAGLFKHAGFAEVQVQAVTIKREPVDPADAVGGNLAALPIAGAISAMSLTAQTHMVEDIVDALSDHVIDGQLVAANSAHIAIAYA